MKLINEIKQQFGNLYFLVKFTIALSLYLSFITTNSTAQIHINQPIDDQVISSSSDFGPSNWESWKYDPNLGEFHNAGLNDLIKNSGISKDLSLQENLDLMKNYFLTKYEINVMPALEGYLSEGRNGIYVSFEPFKFLTQHKKNMSPHLFEQANKLLKETMNLGEDVNAVINTIVEYRESIKKDKKFTSNEAVRFANMLHVFEASVNYWSNNDDNQGADLFRVNKRDYWKIATADFIGGLGGGLLGGPFGAGIGFIGNSATMAIGL